MKPKRLPAEQHRILRLWVLGGPDAIGKHSTQSVRILYRDGWVREGTGPTQKAREYVDQCERGDLSSLATHHGPTS